MCSALACPSWPSAGKKPGLGSTKTESAKAAFPPNVATNQAKLSTCHCAESASTTCLRVKGHIEPPPRICDPKSSEMVAAVELKTKPGKICNGYDSGLLAV